MHLLLTDRLTCPRCGPTFGLILLAHRLEERRVRAGVLGCPNCRDGFEVSEGFVDLRAPPRGELPSGLVGEPPSSGLGPAAEEEEGRLCALLGIVRGPATVALVGGPARHAGAVARAVDDLEVVAVDPDLERWPEAPRVSRVVSAPGLPFFSGTLRAVAVDARLGPRWVAEAARVVSPKGRVVVTEASGWVPEALEQEGLAVLAAEAETVVAARG